MYVENGPVELLRRRAADSADRVALVDGVGNALTYGVWLDEALRSAAALRSMGLQPRGRAVLVFSNADILEYATTYVSVLILTATTCPVPGTYTAREVDSAVRNCRADLVLRPGWRSEASAAGARPPTVDAERGDFLAQILLTSGSTAVPKAVAATYANLARGLTGSYVPLPPTEERDLFVHALPIGGNAAQSMLLTCLTAPEETLVLPSFDSRRFVDALDGFQGDAGTLLIPAMAAALVTHCRQNGVETIGNLTNLGLTGGRSRPGLLGALAELCPNATITNFYTTTEAWPAGVSIEYDGKRPESVGRIRDGRVRVVSDEGRDCKPHEVGAVEFLVPGEERRTYLRSGDAGTADRPQVVTDDLGYLDDENYLYLTGRRTDVIETGGYKVSAAEVEDVVCALPYVADACVFGVPSASMGSVVVLAAVCDEPTEPARLRRDCRERLEPSKCPAVVFVMNELPLNHAGKPDKEALRRRAMARQEGPSSSHDAHDDPLAARLCRLWEEVLELERVESDDNFFLIGGDSLAVVGLLSRVEEDTGVEVGVLDFLENSTPRSLAGLLGAGSKLR
ncbi:hypothetical protein GCM10010420_36540 [Streptomyces glaucosporus]|uniref:Carrier domain-containing protein n=1 Tax=Streptomyces glaucosporus TaxID=284044 RepID=A0ABN3IJT5_9ACTN